MKDVCGNGAVYISTMMVDTQTDTGNKICTVKHICTQIHRRTSKTWGNQNINKNMYYCHIMVVILHYIF